MLQSGKLEQLKTQPQLLTAALLPGGGEGGKRRRRREEQVKEERKGLGGGGWRRLAEVKEEGEGRRPSPSIATLWSTIKREREESSLEEELEIWDDWRNCLFVLLQRRHRDLRRRWRSKRRRRTKTRGRRRRRTTIPVFRPRLFPAVKSHMTVNHAAPIHSLLFTCFFISQSIQSSLLFIWPAGTVRLDGRFYTRSVYTF